MTKNQTSKQALSQSQKGSHQSFDRKADKENFSRRSTKSKRKILSTSLVRIGKLALLLIFVALSIYLAAMNNTVNAALGRFPSTIVTKVESFLFLSHSDKALSATEQSLANKKATQEKEKLPAAAYDYGSHLMAIGDEADGATVGGVSIGNGTTLHLVKSNNFSSVAYLTDMSTAAIFAKGGQRLGQGNTFTYAHDYQGGTAADGFTSLGLPDVYGNSYIDKAKGILASPENGKIFSYTSADGLTTENFVVDQVVFANVDNGAIIDSEGNDIPNTNVTSSANPWNADNSKLTKNGEVMAGTAGQGEAAKFGGNIIQTCGQPGAISMNAKYNQLDEFGEYENRKVEYIMHLSSITYHVDGKTISESFGLANTLPNIPGTGQLTPISYSIQK